MGTDRELQRWVELAAEVLAQPWTAPPTVPLSWALAEDFRATAVGTVELSGGHSSLQPLAPRCTAPVDLGFYGEHAFDAPLLRHFRRTPRDRRVRCSDEVDPCRGDVAVERFVARLRADELDQCLAFPLPAAYERARRWVVVARPDPFDPAERAFARLIHPLVVGLERHASALSLLARLTSEGTTTVPRPRRGADTTPTTLTRREQAVLALMADGLIAQAIGHRLGVSPRTVAKHQERIYRKLDTTDRLTTVLRAQEAGLVGSVA